LLGVWRRQSNQPAVAALYDSKLRIAEQLLQQWAEAHPDLRTHIPVTFDNWYTQPGFRHYVGHTLGLAYVGTLAEDDQVRLKDGLERLDAFAARLKAEHLQAVQAGHRPVFKHITIAYKGEQESYAGQVPDQSARESRVKKYARWVSNKRIGFEIYFLPFADALLACLQQAGQPRCPYVGLGRGRQ